MTCKVCDALLAEYKDAVKLFKTAVQTGSGPIGADARSAAKEVERLRVKVHDSDSTLMAHFRQHQRDLGKEGPTSS